MRATMSLFVVGLLAGVAGLSAAEKSVLTEFKIAGGQTVKCLVTDAGPLPAQNAPFKVEVAGFMIGKDVDSGKYLLIFTFGVSSAKNVKLAKVLVEDVSGEEPVTMLQDLSPKLEKKYWLGNAATPVFLTKQGAPWVFDAKATIKVFKITVLTKNNEEKVMYQPAWYSVDAKKQLVELAAKNG